MTTRVRFCLSFDCFKRDFIASYFNRKHNVVTEGIMMLRASSEVLCHVWTYIFYNMMLSTE